MKGNPIALLFMVVMIGCGRDANKHWAGDHPELSDAEFAERCVGAWISDFNRREFTYGNNGLAITRGTFTNEAGPHDHVLRGTWRVKSGYLYVRATNSTRHSLSEASKGEFRRKLVSVTGTEMITRNTDGVAKTLRRKQ